MFFKILKKDFKRKKVMNIILFIFLLTAGILIASSANLMYSTITAVDYFMEKSDVADVISITSSDQKITQSIGKWIDNSGIVYEYMDEKAIVADEKKVSSSRG